MATRGEIKGLSRRYEDNIRLEQDKYKRKYGRLHVELNKIVGFKNNSIVVSIIREYWKRNCIFG